MFNAQNLQSTLFALGLANDDDLYAKLEKSYHADGRFYHTARHISECLTHLKRLQHLATNVAEIEFAIWYHDVVYDTRKADNEEQSAALAVTYLESRDVEAGVIQRVENMIIATKTHVPSSEDCALLIDVDLGVLGATDQAFENYDKAIRQEYHWVPETDYKKGRAKVLQTFLDRPNIYHTEYFKEHYEAQARSNLSNKITELSR